MSEWRDRMKHAPKLAHSDGMVVVVLGNRTVLMPSEADAQFFYEAYTLVPALENEVATLRTEVSEGVIHETTARLRQVQAENAALLEKIRDLEARNKVEIERRTIATRRATVLAKALVRK